MSLIELMFAMAISAVVVSGAMWLIMQGMISSWKTANVSGNDLAHWGMANRLVFDSRMATGLTVYSAFDGSIINTEGVKGIKSYATPLDVGNFLVLSLVLPNQTTGVWGCTKLTGYVYTPAKSTLYTFTLTFATTDPDYISGLTVPELLVKYFGSIKLVPVATDIALPVLASGGSQGAFYWPTLSAVGELSDTAMLRVRLGDTAQDRRIRDARLIEVSFFIRP